MKTLKFQTLFLITMFILAHTSSGQVGKVYIEETFEFDGPGIESRIITVDDDLNSSDYYLGFFKYGYTGENFTFVFLPNETDPVLPNYYDYNKDHQFIIIELEDRGTSEYMFAYSFPLTMPVLNATEKMDDPYICKIVIYYEGIGPGKLGIRAEIIDEIRPATPDNANNKTSLTFLMLPTLVILTLVKKRFRP